MDKVEYVYGYERRNKQKLPVFTVAIIPEKEDGCLYFGIGLSICGNNDTPVKSHGRKLASARARGALERKGDIESKPRNGDCTDFITLGMRTSWEDAHVSIQDLCLGLALTTRVYRVIRYIKSHFEASIA